MMRGRPTKADQAKIEQQHRKEFEKHYSDLEKCVIGLRQSAANPEWLVKKFGEELSAFAKASRPVRTARGTLSPSALKSEAISDYLVQSQRLTALRKMAALVTVEVEEAATEAERLQFEILRLLWDEVPVDRYQRELAEKFDLAGLTRSVAQAMDEDQIADFVSHVQAAAQARKDRLPQRLDAKNAIRADWRKILDGTPLATIMRVPCPPDDPELIKLTTCGLPPFSKIESYVGDSEQLDRFHRGDPQIKLRAARKIMNDWARSQDYRAQPPIEHRKVWMAFLSLKYGFADELLGKKELKVPSPWATNEIVILTRN